MPPRWCFATNHARLTLPSPDLFLSKPLRDAAIPALRAHAVAHAEQRAVEQDARSATREAKAAVDAAAAGAAAAHAIMGPPVVRAQLQHGAEEKEKH